MSIGAIDPRRYHEAVGAALGPAASADPVCLYLETTNRCNMLCTTCPRTYADLEPEADMSWELFARIVGQVPNIARVVLHGVGEPMLVRDLARRVRYLKERGIYVLFNTNGTALTLRRGRQLAEAGLDELRVSLDAADAPTFLKVRGTDDFNRILRNVGAFTGMQAREGLERPRVSLWLTGLKENIAQLPAFVRLAHDIGVKEVYLQRLVFCEQTPYGMATPDQALFARLSQEEAQHLAAAEAAASALGIAFNASGATEPGESSDAQDRRQPLVAVPAAVDGDVHHGQRPGAPLLHRAVLAAGLRELHPRRCHPADAAGNLERPCLPGVPRGAQVGRSAQVLRRLRAALEPVGGASLSPRNANVPSHSTSAGRGSG